jgi:hypothetical protein
MSVKVGDTGVKRVQVGRVSYRSLSLFFSSFAHSRTKKKKERNFWTNQISNINTLPSLLSFSFSLLCPDNVYLSFYHVNAKPKSGGERKKKKGVYVYYT